MAHSRIAPASLILASCLATGLMAPPTAGAAEISPEQAKAVALLQEQALASQGAWDFVAGLTTQVGNRFAGSPRGAAAVAWAKAKLEAMGFPVVRLEPVTVPRWVRGEARGRIVGPWPQPVVVLALGGSVATPPGGLTAEVVRVASVAALESLPAGAVQGKIVFFDGGLMPAAKDGSGYRKAVEPRAIGADRAAPLGAVAVLIRSAGSSRHRFAHTGSMRITGDGPKIPAAALSNADADLLSAQLDSGQPVSFHLELETQDLGTTESFNVIAEVPGREKPDEIVLLGAHLDSWDVGTGALDDGSGCAIVSEAARLIAALPERPRRTIRVVLFANEEFGLSGARAYAEAHAAELDRHVMATEADLGAGRVWAFRSAVAPERLDVVAEIAAIFAPMGIVYGGNDARGGADISPLLPARVPRFDLAQDATLYFDVHHTEDDTLDKVVPADLAQNVAAWATIAYLAADLPQNFGRAPEAPERRR